VDDPRSARRGLGRGLSALLGDPVVAPPEGADAVRTVPTDAIRPNPHQPRRTIDESALAVLADSIARHGLMQPIVVRRTEAGDHEIIAGERRWRAAVRAGLEAVPVVVREADDRERLELALVENLVREDLSPMEVARAVAALVEDFGQTHQTVADHLGRSRPAVSNLLRLLELPDEVQAMVDRGLLSEGHGRAILMADGARARRLLAEQVVERGLSVRETERRARAAAAPAPPPAPPVEAADLTDSALELFTAAFETPVRVRPRARGGVVVELRFDDEGALRRAMERLTGSGGAPPAR
jgi:ParB family transcriptional regulator, chromosome partitioning protein